MDRDRWAPPYFEEEVPVSDGLAVWQPATTGWDSGRYVLSVDAGAESRTVIFDLNARARVAVPWGLSDSPDAQTPGAVSAALGEQWLRVGDHVRAREMFEAALRENPNLGRVRLALGRDSRSMTGNPGPRPGSSNRRSPRRLRTRWCCELLGDAHRESARQPWPSGRVV